MAHEELDDTYITVRFKYGLHTILLFVDTLKPFSEITTTLLEILRDRFPEGLAKSHISPETTDLPDPETSRRIAYAVPINPTDLTLGWKNLKIEGNETPVMKGLKDGCAVAFAFIPEEAEGDVQPEFIVDVPTLDYGDEEPEEEDDDGGI